MVRAEDYMRLARRIARRFKGRGMEMDDLVGYAYVGLMRGIRASRERPDEVTEEGFERYLGRFIYGTICNHYLAEWRPMWIPYKVGRWACRVRNGYATLDDVPSASLRARVKDAVSVMMMGREAVYMDSGVDNGSSDEEGVAELLSLLTDREALAIQYYLGLGENTKRTYVDVASLMGCSEMTARSLVKKGLEKMKIYMEGGQIRDDRPRFPDDAEAARLAEEASRLEGRERRLFMARAVSSMGRGGRVWAEKKVGWSQTIVKRGLRELRELEAVGSVV